MKAMALSHKSAPAMPDTAMPTRETDQSSVSGQRFPPGSLFHKETATPRQRPLESGKNKDGPALHSEPEDWPHCDLALRNQRRIQVHDAAGSTNQRTDLGVDHKRQPFRLRPHAHVAIEVDFDTPAQPKRETREAAVRSGVEMSCTHAADHEWPRPSRPVFWNVLVREITVELIQDHAFTRTCQMEMSVLSCPTELDQVLLVESHPCCNPIAQTSVKAEAGGCYPVLPGGEGHARSIADERGDINPKRPGLGGRVGIGLRSKFSRAQDKYYDN